ncbi:cation:proton antiporter [Methylohalobius crimeensis]|uniref:cation:proton antiporter n=1 Tax=Methylohalobius crimeensis TaxID=244365 RepID=UPI0004131B03|nr:sodium:proton antiporter [Methylohalobius crimeensis]
MMHSQILWSLVGIGLISIVCQWIAWRVKLPAILFLLLAGIAAGPVSGWLSPDTLFGDLLFPMISLAVAVILFEGSLTLKFEQIRGLEKVVRNLVTLGVLITWWITALATRYLVGFTWDIAILFGALMVVTGPTVIVPLLRSVRPNRRVSNILRWEGIVIDPLGALLAVLVFEFIRSSYGSALTLTASTFGKILLDGLLLGSFAGYCFGLALRNFWIPDYLHNVTALILVFGVYALADTLETEAGLLAVTVMGMWLANMPGVPVKEILNFKESLSIFLISGLFILLAARLDFSRFQDLGFLALAGVFLVTQFIARPAGVWLSTLNSDLTSEEKTVLALIGPRGIVAAAVTGLFAIRLEQHGYPKADLLVPLAFTVIIGTVAIQSAFARLLTKHLGVSEPEGGGFLIVGANAVARTLAEALQDLGIQVMLTDSSWDHVKTARLEGLPAYYGNLTSEHADWDLDLVGLDGLLALSPSAELNALASCKYAGEFGTDRVYMIQAEKEEENRHRTAATARILFDREITFAVLASRIGQGAIIRQTKLTENFDFEAYRARYRNRAIPLFLRLPDGELEVITTDRKLTPKPGSTLLALIQPESGEETAPTAESRTLP